MRGRGCDGGAEWHRVSTLGGLKRTVTLSFGYGGEWGYQQWLLRSVRVDYGPQYPYAHHHCHHQQPHPRHGFMQLHGIASAGQPHAPSGAPGALGASPCTKPGCHVHMSPSHAARTKGVDRSNSTGKSSSPETIVARLADHGADMTLSATHAYSSGRIILSLPPNTKE